MLIFTKHNDNSARSYSYTDMKHVYFATGNERKFDEANYRLAELCPDVTINQLEVDIPEIQSDDPKDVIQQKVDYVRQLTELPFIVDDAYFDTDRYPGFPGAYTKFVNSTLGKEGWKRLFDEGDSIRAMANVALHHLGSTYHFSGQVDGTLRLNSLEPSSDGNLLSDVMHVSPEITLGEALRSSDFDNHRGQALSRLAEWVNTQNSRSDLQKVEIGRRWSERSTGWKDIIEDTDSYVNFEENYARVNAMIKKYAPLVSGNALEVGCGTGEAGRILKQANTSLSLLSTDISDGMLAEAKRQTNQAGLTIEYQKLDITTGELDALNFDMVLSRGVVVSHLPRTDVIDWLEAITRCTKEGGYFLFDFIQSVQVGDVDKPVDSKNEFTLDQMDSIMNELGWERIDNSGTDEMRVQVACYRRNA